MPGPNLLSTRSQFIVPPELFESEPKPFLEPGARRAFRLLRMVQILHGKGFHGLRVCPYEYPIAYRVELFPARFADCTGAKFNHSIHMELVTEPNRDALRVSYSSAMESAYFGQHDATKMNAHQLAVKFIEWFPALARETYCLDYAYAGWFATMMAHCEYGFLPYLFGDYEEEYGAMRMQHVGDLAMDWFPLPPSPGCGNALQPNSTPRWMEQE